MRGLLKVVLCVVITFGMLSGVAMAQSAIGTWTAPTTNADGSPLVDLAGYKLYYGSISGVYGTPTDVGNVLTYTVEMGNVEGQTYYYALTAYDYAGNESVHSNEVSVTFPTLAPSPPTSLQVVVD